MPSTQKALVLPEKFAELVIQPAISVPQPGAGQLLLKIKAVALNPIDWKVQRLGMYLEKFPAILGLDIAGDVEEVGDGVLDFKKGDRV